MITPLHMLFAAVLALVQPPLRAQQPWIEPPAPQSQYAGDWYRECLERLGPREEWPIRYLQFSAAVPTPVADAPEWVTPESVGSFFARRGDVMRDLIVATKLERREPPRGPKLEAGENTSKEQRDAWGDLRWVQRLLLAEAQSLFSIGRHTDAMDRIAASIRLTGQLAREGRQLTALVGDAMLDLSCETLLAMIDAWPHGPPSHQSLAEVRAALQELDRLDPAGFRRAFDREGRRNLEWMRSMPDPGPEIARDLQGGLDEAGIRSLVSFYRRWPETTPEERAALLDPKTLFVLSRELDDPVKREWMIAELQETFESGVPLAREDQAVARMTREQVLDRVAEAERLLDEAIAAWHEPDARERLDAIRKQVIADDSQIAAIVVGPVLSLWEGSRTSDKFREARERVGIQEN